MEDAYGCELRNRGNDKPSYVQMSSLQSPHNSNCRYLGNAVFQLLQEQKSLTNETIKVKHKIKTEIIELTALLKKRELELCEKVNDIYQHWNSYIINEMANPNNSRMDSIWCRNKTDYVSSFDELKNLIKEYGTLGTFENKNRSSLDLNDRHVTNKSASNLNSNPEISNFNKHNLEGKVDSITEFFLKHDLEGKLHNISEGKEHDLKEECMSMNSEDCIESTKEKPSTESLDSFEVLDSSNDMMPKKCFKDSRDLCKLTLESNFASENLHSMENWCFNQCRRSSEVSNWLSNTTEAKNMKMNSIIPSMVSKNETYLQYEPSSQLKNQLNNQFRNSFSNQEASHLQRVKYICMDLKNGFNMKSFHSDASSISEWLHKKEYGHAKCISQQLKQAPACTTPSDLIKQSFNSFLVKENKNNWLHCNAQTR